MKRLHPFEVWKDAAIPEDYTKINREIFELMADEVIAIFLNSPNENNDGGENKLSMCQLDCTK